MSNWYTASCKECGSDIHCHVDWERTPDLCKGCIEKKKAARAKWHEKSCSCGSAIRYHEDWDRIPDLCRDCIAKKRAARAKWREKSCPCGNVVSYHEDWSNPPSRCKECNAWQTKTCAAQDCSETIRYKRYWDRVPEYCNKCKSGERRIVVRQQKDDGTVHEYEGRGYVNKQGAAVFKDDSSSGKHSHAVYEADGSVKGRRDEGHDQEWVNEPINVSLTSRARRGRDIVRRDRITTMYKDRGTDNHVHEYAKGAARDVPGQKGFFKIAHVEGAAGEYAPRERRKREE